MHEGRRGKPVEGQNLIRYHLSFDATSGLEKLAHPIDEQKDVTSYRVIHIDLFFSTFLAHPPSNQCYSP